MPKRQSQEERRLQEFPNLRGKATFSPDGAHRYLLTRTWGEKGAPRRTLAVIGLNPSTADAEKDDPTIGRCMRFAKRWGFNRLLMVNLFSFKATKPADMAAQAEAANDPLNDDYLTRAAQEANTILAAWGAHPLAEPRARTLFELPEFRRAALGKTQALLITSTGNPGHPLYIPGDTEPQPWWPKGLAALEGVQR